MARRLIPLVEIPTIALLYKLGILQPITLPTTKIPNETYNNKIALISNDITVLQINAIVNAANPSLLGGSGVDGAIHQAAGPGLRKECSTLNGCATGSAKITNGHKLPCEKVIHAVGPVYSNHRDPAALLKGCYRTSLELAVENGLKSIAFSSLSTGVYGFPHEEAAEAALGEVRRFLDSGKGDGLEKVVFCTFTAKDEAAYQKMIPKIFPPTEYDLPTKDDQPQRQGHEGELLPKLPDPPTFDPAHHGQPTAKKLKVGHFDTEGDWESIEKPGSDAKSDEEMVTIARDDAQDEPGASDESATGFGGGGQSYNRLMKDW